MAPESDRSEEEFRLLHAGAFLAALQVAARDYLHARAVLETVIESVTVPAYRAMALTRLARLAAICGAPELAEKWLEACPSGLRIAEIASVPSANVDPIDDEHVKVRVNVQRRTRSVDTRDRAGRGAGRVRQAGPLRPSSIPTEQRLPEGLERGIEFSTCGSWTLEDESAERGAEPDECYVFGSASAPTRPHLAIEVVWTSGGIDKLEVYRKLGVREVWYWRRGRITPFVLEGETYEERTRSEALPGIDLELLGSFVDRPTTSAAIREYRAALARG